MSDSASDAIFSALKALPTGTTTPRSLASELSVLAQSGGLDDVRDGYTLLGLATGLGLLPWVKALLRLGADPNAADDQGNTPFHLLARYHQSALAPVLIKAGADPTQTNAAGQCALDLAVGRHAVALLDTIETQSPSARTTALQAHLSRFDDPSIVGFLRVLAWKTQRLGVQFELSDEVVLPYNGNPDVPVSGFFVQSPTPRLGVAVGKDPQEWLLILAHEASHMDQWSGKAAVWNDNIMPDGQEAVDWIDRWISGETFSSEQLDQAFTAAKHVELDCERRTIEKCQSFGLPVDVHVYAQKANAYVHFYDHVKRTRAWNAPGQAPYEIQAVWSQAEPTLSETPNSELIAAFEAHWPVSSAPTKRSRGP